MTSHSEPQNHADLPHMTPIPRSKIHYLTDSVIAISMAMIFALDLRTPLGLAVPFLYLFVALFAIGAGANGRVLLLIAVLGPVLAGVKLLLHPSDGVAWFGQANRVAAALLIWLAVGLEWVRRTLELDGLKIVRNSKDRSRSAPKPFGLPTKNWKSKLRNGKRRKQRLLTTRSA